MHFPNMVPAVTLCAGSLILALVAVPVPNLHAISQAERSPSTIVARSQKCSKFRKIIEYLALGHCPTPVGSSNATISVIDQKPRVGFTINTGDEVHNITNINEDSHDDITNHVASDTVHIGHKRLTSRFNLRAEMIDLTRRQLEGVSVELLPGWKIETGDTNTNDVTSNTDSHDSTNTIIISGTDGGKDKSPTFRDGKEEEEEKRMAMKEKKDKEKEENKEKKMEEAKEEEEEEKEEIAKMAHMLSAPSVSPEPDQDVDEVEHHVENLKSQDHVRIKIKKDDSYLPIKERNSESDIPAGSYCIDTRYGIYTSTIFNKDPKPIEFSIGTSDYAVRCPEYIPDPALGPVRQQFRQTARPNCIGTQHGNYSHVTSHRSPSVGWPSRGGIGPACITYIPAPSNRRPILPHAGLSSPI